VLLEGPSRALCLGGDCALCGRPACRECSLYYSHRLCFGCLARGRHEEGVAGELPAPVLKEYTTWAAQHAETVAELQSSAPPERHGERGDGAGGGSAKEAELRDRLLASMKGGAAGGKDGE